MNADADHAGDSPPVFAPDRLADWTRRAYEAVGVPRDDAALIARLYVQTSLRGIDTHGMVWVPRSIDHIRSGGARAKTKVSTLGDHGPCLALDAGFGIGQVAGFQAMQRTIMNARAFGVGVTTLRHNNHFGAADNYAMMALEHDMIGLATTNADAAMAPWGGRTRMFGTNPIAMAVPAGQAFPVVMDFATSVVSRGKFRQYLRDGLALPAGWALDSAGRPTTDPAEALAGLCLPIGGHKGYAIGLMVTILTGVLSGGRLDTDVPIIGEVPGREQGSSQLFAALRVDAFQPLDEFEGRMDELIRRIAASERVDPAQPILLPGQREHQTAARRRERGIPVPENVVETLRKTSDELGVPWIEA